MGYIRLHPKDAEKFGVSEEIPFSLAGIGTRQRGALEKSPIGPRKPWTWLLNQLQGVPELDGEGNAIPVPVVDEQTGEPVIDEATGEPKVELKLTRDPDTIAMFVWIALWGAGVKVPWDSFDVREVGLQMSFVDGDDEVDEGKAGATETESSTTTAP